MSDSVSEYGLGAPNTEDHEAITPEVEADRLGRRGVAEGMNLENDPMSDSVSEYGLGAPTTQENVPDDHLEPPASR